jgi:hypothetical protein
MHLRRPLPSMKHAPQKSQKESWVPPHKFFANEAQDFNQKQRTSVQFGTENNVSA